MPLAVMFGRKCFGMEGRVLGQSKWTEKDSLSDPSLL